MSDELESPALTPTDQPFVGSMITVTELADIIQREGRMRCSGWVRQRSASDSEIIGRHTAFDNRNLGTQI